MVHTTSSAGAKQKTALWPVAKMVSIYLQNRKQNFALIQQHWLHNKHLYYSSSNKIFCMCMPYHKGEIRGADFLYCYLNSLFTFECRQSINYKVVHLVSGDFQIQWFCSNLPSIKNPHLSSDSKNILRKS